MTDREREYADAMGVEALERQRREVADRHTCCGEWKDGPHHPDCGNWTEPPPEVHPDQEALL